MHHATWRARIGLLGALALASGCNLAAGLEDFRIVGAGGMSGGTSTGGGSSTGAGGMGGTSCADPAITCPKPPSACVIAICNPDGSCGTAPVGAGMPSGDQTAGDCKKVVCDAKGAPVTVHDDADVEDDHAICTVDACADGSPVHTPQAAGLDCSAEGPAPAKVCADPADPNRGKCVECNVATQITDCPVSQLCQDNTCVFKDCNDGVKNGAETDVDCGGADCGACADRGTCVTADDCASGVCKGSVCQAPTCGDTVKNGAETAADCGGSCPKCGDGKACSAGADCTSGVCLGGTCQAPACDDGLENGTETGLDCGGACAPAKACPNGPNTCQGNLDCESDHCVGGACVECVSAFECPSQQCLGNICAPGSCNDGIKNGTETGVDCGGACAPAKACPNGPNKCMINLDCQSGHCAGFACVECAFNGDCPSGHCVNTLCVQCAQNLDCPSMHCVGGMCAAPSCNDGIKNGAETDLDCGGSCPKCAAGKMCSMDADCLSGTCPGGICGP